MITITYPLNSKQIDTWKERLSQLFLKYELVESNIDTEHKLTDGDKQLVGTTAVETYLDEQQQLVNGWYEDRCDRHDFDPDAQSAVQQ